MFIIAYLTLPYIIIAGVGVVMLPLLLGNNKDAFIVYIWAICILLLLLSVQGLYWEYIHPLGCAFGRIDNFLLWIAQLLYIPALLSIVLVILWKKLFIEVFKRFIVPVILIFILIYFFFQGYLLFSAHNAYESAKKMQAKNINAINMYDFYSPTIKHIQIQAGEPKRYYRWSYRRGRYVFEINQPNIAERNTTSKNLSFWYMPSKQYAKDYHFSIPKTYIKTSHYYGLNTIIIPSNSPLFHYFNFDHRLISVHADNDNSIMISLDKKFRNQYGLQKGIGHGYYYDDDREKYGHYLIYSNDTISIQCPYHEDNICTNQHLI